MRACHQVCYAKPGASDPRVIASRAADAAAQGLSRSEYLPRRFGYGVLGGRDTVVTMADLRRASDAARDLLDEQVMRDAWG